MISVDEARAAILARVQTMDIERVPLAEAYDRVLAEDCVSALDLPPFANSAMDGFAVHAADTAGATPEKPVLLNVSGEVAAGDPLPTTAVAPGNAVRIMTGAPVPPAADAVVMIEDTAPVEPGRVAIHAAAAPEQHIRPAGEDVRCGECVVTAGTWLTPAAVAMLAAQGQAHVPVYRRPRVAVVTTGNEIVDVDEPLGPGKIHDSNSYALRGQLQEAGAELHSLTRAVDDEARLQQTLAEAADADFIVTSGGVSVGDYDFVKASLEKLGTVHFWRVNMKPGKPVLFGELAGRLFFGLPGNPVSSMVAFEIFVRPALRKALGCAECVRPEVEAVLDSDCARNPKRLEFIRATLHLQDGRLVAAVTGPQRSGRLSTMVRANALLVVPPGTEPLRAGTRVRAMLITAN